MDPSEKNSSPGYLTLENLWKAIVAVVALILLSLLISDVAFSQRPGSGEGAEGAHVTPGLSFEVEQWATPDKTYMNRMSAHATIEARWRLLWAEVAASAVWWGSGRSKVSGSLLNTESGKVIERRRSAALGLTLDVSPSWRIRLGGIIQRRGIHHIWQYKRRHDYFPGSWEAGVSGCNGGKAPDWPSDQPQCPSIGYWDVIASLLVARGRWKGVALRFRVEAPAQTWKTLTLPYPRARFAAQARLREWRFRLRSEAFGPAGFGYDAEISRTFPPVDQVRLGLTTSDHLPDPGWGRGPGDNLARVGATITVSSDN